MTQSKRLNLKIKGTGERPRLAVFRSQRWIYAQIIDDQKGQTLVAASEKEIGTKDQDRLARAKLVGEALAKKAVKAGLKKVVFDRRGYRYHGRVKALAEGARQAGLKF